MIGQPVGALAELHPGTAPLSRRGRPYGWAVRTRGTAPPLRRILADQPEFLLAEGPYRN